VVKSEDVERAVTKALDAKACKEHWAEPFTAARNYMFSCDGCIRQFSATVTKWLNKKRK